MYQVSSILDATILSLALPGGNLSLVCQVLGLGQFLMISPLSFPEVQAGASMFMSPVLDQTDILVYHLRFTDGFQRPWEEVRALKLRLVEVRGRCGGVGGRCTTGVGGPEGGPPLLPWQTQAADTSSVRTHLPFGEQSLLSARFCTSSLVLF